jgi:hypothetical protein
VSNTRKLKRLKPGGVPLTPRHLPGLRPMRSAANRDSLARSQELSAALPLDSSIPGQGDRCVRFAGDLYRLPGSEAEVWQWCDAMNDDKRLDRELRMFCGMLAGTMVRALRTGEGIVTA